MGFCPDGKTEVSTFLKYFLMLGTFLHWIAALLMIAFGAWSFQERNKYYYQEITTIYEFFLDLSIILMVVGSLMFLITFCGFVGALRENTCLLRVFYICLTVIFLLEVIGIALVVVFKEKARDWATDVFKNIYIENYQDDEEMVGDFFQEKFDCCGVDGYQNWNDNVYFNCSDDNPSYMKCTVPYSCCKVEDEYQSGLTNIFCGKDALKENAELSNIYTIGCLDAVMKWVEDNLPLFGGLCAVVLVPQLMGIILGRLFAGQIESQLDRNQLAARRRWYRRGIL